MNTSAGSPTVPSNFPQYQALMTRIDPQIAAFQTRLKSKLKSSPPSRPAGEASVPADSVDIVSEARVSKAEQKPRKSFGRYLLEKSLMGGMALTTIAGALTGIGVATNYDVLKEAVHQETPVTLFKAEKSAQAGGGSGAPCVCAQGVCVRRVCARSVCARSVCGRGPMAAGAGAEAVRG